MSSMESNREAYVSFIMSKNRAGSNRATSYIRALDLVDSILKRKASGQLDAPSIWEITSLQHLQQLYLLVLEHQRLGEEGIFEGEKPISYWRDRFCSAALKSYKQFLVADRYEQKMWQTYHDTSINPNELSSHLADTDVDDLEILIEDKDLDLAGREGRDAIREVKTRIGQGFFRKMILMQYNTQCCITGLNVPEVLRASHITSWADDPDNRVNPANGLCLSATYDAAFDKHLISFDDDYRMILSSLLKDYYTNTAFKEYFLSREGKKIARPLKFQPDLKFLDKHRTRMIM